ncbi:ATP-binding cassette domain-containing protein [Micromonospora sp. CPCC 206060]|uniref:ATP-binding cassette domain-containing protein n=1 Tax=Micromonospora sp. CPCC 206060 TaxID=3122406 RepID=UPI002FF0F46C
MVLADLVDVTVTVGRRPVLRHVTFSLRRGSVTSLTGPSGTGKTSLLATVAGLRRPAAGVVRRFARRQAVVFQEPRLLPWCTIGTNVSLVARRTAAEIAAVLDEVGLDGTADRFPHQLSGGMRQRAALARALAAEPDLLILDEPFSALDQAGRSQLQELVMQRVGACGTAVLWVTHDHAEARMAEHHLRLEKEADGSVVLRDDYASHAEGSLGEAR